MKQVILFLAFGFFQICVAQQEENQLADFEKEAQQYVFTGNEQLLEGSVLEGEKSYRSAIATNPDNIEAKYNLGYSYYKTNNFQEAAMRNKQAVKLAKTKPEKHIAYHNLGNSYLKMQKPDEAIEAYKNALRNDPYDEETRYNLAVAKKMKEQQDQNKDQNQDQQQNDEDKKDDQNKEQDKKESDEGDEGDEDKDDKEEGDNKDENEEEKDSEDKKEDEKDGDKGDEEDQENKQPPKPREGKLSPDQVKSLLEAMADEEKKVQDKMNEKKQGVRVQSDKDW